MYEIAFVFCSYIFFLLAIVLFVFRFTCSHYSFGIFKLFYSMFNDYSIFVDLINFNLKARKTFHLLRQIPFHFIVSPTLLVLIMLGVFHISNVGGG